MGEKETLRTFIEDGYLYACTLCPVDKSRHGPKVTGKRDIFIRKCKKHEGTKGVRDEDLERLEKTAWSVDPPKAKYFRYKKIAPERVASNASRDF